MLSQSTMAIVRNTFTGPRARAQAIGVFAAMFGISMALGPVRGGFLVSAVSWRAVFVVNLPVGLAAIVLAARFVPESLAPRPRRLDPAGPVLVITALAALTYAVIEGGRAGFGTARIMILLAVAAGCFAGLVLCELRRGDPLLEVRFFASAPVCRCQRHRRLPDRGARRLPAHEHALPPGRPRSAGAARGP